jgi:spore maturation protein CgeB
MWPWYHKACAEALASLGCQVEKFSWFDDFYRWQHDRVEPVYKSKRVGLQNRFLIGPVIWAINHRLIEFARQHPSDVIWFYNSTHIFPATVRRLRRLLPKVLLVQYTNDNPFTTHIKPDYWRHFKRSIPDFDVHFIFRPTNEQDFLSVGAKSVHLLRAYYLPSKDYRVTLQPGDDRYQSDVVFAGHYEPDGRLESLEAISAAGYHLKLFGGGWMKYVQLTSDSPLRYQLPITPVIGEDYRKAISGTKIALCFLSKVNRDSYTTRNFEIPAMGAFMLSEYSDDLASLFTEGIEAEYFRSRQELLDKIKFYLNHEGARQKIAENGYKRVIEDGHDVKSRMRMFLEIINAERIRKGAN